MAEDGTSTRVPLDTERLSLTEGILERLPRYLPPQEVLSLQPTTIDLASREAFQKARPGDYFALVYYPPEEKLIIVPSDHPLNELPGSSNMAVYGSGSMETLTFEGSTNPDGSIREGSIVLLEDRMNRLYERSLPAREVNLPVERTTLAQGIADLMAILGTDVLVEPDGTQKIGSIRVTVGPGMGKFGKRAVGQQVFASVEAYRTNKDFDDEARDGRGIAVAAGPNQRSIPFRGKLSSQYGEAARIAEEAKRAGGKDAILFAEYMAHDPSQTVSLDRLEEPQVIEETMLHLALSNGLGAETMAIRLEEDGLQTLLLPPNEGPLTVKRLGGVTADYVMDHMAPAMGIKTAIDTWSLQDILDGKIIGMFYAGNAARLAEITKVILHTKDGQILREIQLPPVPEIEQALVNRFEAEVSGEIPPSDNSLLTHVDFTEGREARAVLEKAWANWLQPKLPERTKRQRIFPLPRWMKGRRT